MRGWQRRSAARRAARRRGFTVIEVMVAIGVMTMGAMAIIGLQQQVVRANIEARQMTIATDIAQTWIERLRQDGASWVTVALPTSPPGAPDSQQTVLANSLWLRSIVAAPFQFTMANVPQGAPPILLSNAFNYWGEDVLPTAANITYCASYRLSWVYFGRLIRADVRVFWPRRALAPAVFPNLCNDPVPGGPLAAATYRSVYMSSVIRVSERNY